MSTTIRLKRSAVPGRVPTTSQLELGELAINTADGKIYIKQYDAVSNTSSIVEFSASPDDILDLLKTVDGAGSELDADLLDGQQGTYYLDYNNFTNTPSNTNILDSIKDVDGPGSGLDADTLDGLDSTQFLRSDENDTFSGDLTITGNLTVTGNTTYVNTEEILLSDNVIVLNANFTGPTASENAGIEVERGGESNVVLQWNESLNQWEIASGGVTGRILTTGDEGSGNGLDADTLDGQEGSYYLDFTNATNKPDPQIDVTLSGKVTGSGSTTLTNLTNGSISITTALSDTGVTSGSYGSSTAIPVITVDEDGRITNVVTSSVAGIDSTNWYSANNTYQIQAGDGSIFNSKISQFGSNVDFGAGIDVSGNITVTGTVDGRDIALDGLKLDGIESGATGDQTPAEILAAIKTVDGAGSGLDADLFDGLNSTQFLRSDTNDELVGDLTVTGDVYIRSSGDNGWRFRPAVTSGSQYGFADQHGNAQVFTNEQGTVNQAFILGDTDPGNSADLFGVSVISGGTNPTTGSEAGWTKKLALKGDGNLYIGPSGTTRVLTTADEGAGNGLDADTLDGQQGTYYLDFANFTNIPDPTITVTGDVEGTVTLTNLGNGSLSLELTDTGVLAGSYGSSTAIPVINVDVDGRVTSVSTAAINGIESLDWYSANNTLQIEAGDGSFFNAPINVFSDITVEDLSANSIITQSNVTVNGNIVVTGTVDGRDVSADGSKLDGIESGATGDQTPAEILTAIKTVDGVGSGLDADLLDGLNSTQFLRSDVNDTFSGDLVISGNLTVSGTTTTVNTETILLSDNIITLNANHSGPATQNAGIEVERGSDSNVILQWNEGSNYWEIASGGVTGRILTTGDEGAGNGLDADTLDGQQGTYYLDYTNFTNTPSDTDILNQIKNVDGSGSGLDADLLDGQNSTYYLDYTNFSNTPTASDLLTDIKTVDGVGSGLDADLLDGQQGAYYLDYSNFTNTPSASDLLTQIKTVDGVGSGLDADLLDGQQGSYYLDFTNATNKPDPQIDVTLSGKVTGTGSTTLTNLGNGSISITTALENTGVTAATYGSSLSIPVLTIDEDGRVTSASTETLQAGATVSSTNWYSSNNTFNITLSDNSIFNTVISQFDSNVDFGSGIDVTGNITVTGTVDGRDIAADGTKLDGIESGATGDQTPAEILTAIKTVDGTGSGLDADLLDGQHAQDIIDAASAQASGNVGNATITIDAGDALTGGGTFTVNQFANTTITIDHADTSSVSNVNNSGGTVIQDLTFDAYGHVQTVGSTNLDGRYYTEAELDAGQLDNRYYTETELDNGALDGRYYTESQADARFVNVTGDTVTGNIILDNQADLIFRDNNGTFPTQSGGFVWDLNNDSASIYAQQPSSDQIDFFFKITDNAGSTDRFVFWVDDYRGSAYDRYPAQFDGSAAYLAVPVDGSGNKDLNNARFKVPFIGNATIDGSRIFADNYHPNADKWTTARTVTFSGGDVTGSFSIDGSANVSGVNLTIQPDSVALGTDTTGNYVQSVSQGTGITVTGGTGEGSTPTIAHADTSSVTNVSTSGKEVISSITFDTFGHVTARTTRTLDVITQAEADARYVNVDGDTMTGDLTVQADIIQDHAAYVTASATTTATTPSNILSFNSTTFNSAEVIITATQGINRHITKLLIVHNGTTASATEFGTIYTNNSLASYDVGISGGNVNLTVTAASATSTEYKIAATLIID